MKTETKKVRTGGNVVGEVDIPVYETVVELTEKEDESRILGMFNKQNAVRIMGNERAKHTLARVGKGKRFDIAYNLLWDILDPEEAQEVLGNVEKLKEVINSDKVQNAVDEWIEEQKKDEPAS